MASFLPIPAPPRTPTPPTPMPMGDDPGGLGIMVDLKSLSPHNMSPVTEAFPHRFGAMATPMASAKGSPIINNDGTFGSVPSSPKVRNPFNFQTQTIKEAPVARSVRTCSDG